MQHRAQRVDIGPCALLALVVVAVLLNRCIAGTQHRLALIRQIADSFTRRPEVQQDRLATALNLDVIQRDIAVQIARFMDGFDRAQQRWQHATDPGLIYRLRISFAEVRERGAAVEHRAHVGGVVLHPETQHVQQVRMVKARQQTRLLNKAIQSGVKGFAEPFAAQHQIQIIATDRQ